MERQNSSSHPIIPSGFANSSFASTFTGITSPAGNVSNPLLMSTLHHLQGLSAAGSAAALLPSTPQLTLGGQFASEFNNIATMGWPAQNASAAWFEQAKVAAMLPMYGVLSAGGVKSGYVSLHSISPNYEMTAPVDANALTPPMRSTSGSSQSVNASALLSNTCPVSISSGVFPINSGGNFMNNLQECSPREQQQSSEVSLGVSSATPQRMQQSSALSLKKSISSSPIDANMQMSSSGITVVDMTRPSSIQSHTSSEIIRPGSSSAVSSHGAPSSVVSIHSNIGSVECPVASAIHQPASVSALNSIEITGVTTASVRPNSLQSASCAYQIVDLHNNPSHSHPASVETSSSSIPTPGSQGSVAAVQQQQQISAYDLTAANQHMSAMHVEPSSSSLLSTSGDVVNAPTTSTDIVQDFTLAHDQQTPGSSHENALDAGNLEDLPWSSIDLGDIDLFGVASAADKDVMHSVLDMDPSIMNRLFSNDPPQSSFSTTADTNTKAAQRTPPSSCVPPVVQMVTPKIREKIKMRREKELADADKELDRLLSLVAKKDAKSTPKPKIPPSLPLFDPLLFVKPEENSSDKKISLSPVQFTPPDSPTPSTSSTSIVTSSFFFPTSQPSTSSAYRTTTNVAVQRPEPSPSVTPYVFMPTVDKKPKCNKIPIYKQKSKTFVCTTPKSEDPPAKSAADDAYSFTDDEEEGALPSGATMSESQLKEQRLEAEVAQKLARINSVHPELKHKIACLEAQSQQDLWRHVVPKKRHTAAVAERPCVPSTPLLPPASASDQRADTAGTSAQKAPEVLTLAESLQRRKQYRSSYGFLKTKCLDDKNTAKNECSEQPSVISIKVEPQEEYKPDNGLLPQYRPLPKLLIRLPKRSLQESPSRSEKSKKKKKRKRKDRDREWEGSEKKRKKKKHKHKHHKREHEYEARVITVDDEQWRNAEPINRPAEMAIFSKKRRLMMQWNDDEEHYVEPGSRQDDTCRRYSSTLLNECERRGSLNDSTEWSLPTKFSQANGHLTKGTFVVCKADILKEECPLWRVDNQNLLQKYPPIKMDNKIAYKNSSTYSGWCDQIADGYLVVEVRFLKHTRSESIVEPHLPLFDMFPAVSSEVDEKTSQCSDVENGIATSSSNSGVEVSLKDPIRDQMSTYVRAMLNHGLSLSFLQSVKQGNDWNYLRALNDIDRLNQDRKEKVLSRVKWVERYIDMLHFYSSCVACDAEGGGLNCQACGKRPVERVVQLFSNEGYDYDTLESEEMRYTGSGSPMPAMEYLVCSLCAKLSLTYHKLHHMRYLLLKKCEDQVIDLFCCALFIALSPVNFCQTLSADYFIHADDLKDQDAVVENCMRNTKWLHATINEYADLWRKIELNDC
ncbi:unnamed protein product [Anisakis simplex]|uniref:EOR-2 (inferred by orthology to a C. elegans protein) n=1 Tax=Anisakis simplex TaxID=6269 RepID=A0A158PNB0_ANISI|nr:unnamed protein product [Anisakis simplex]